MAKVAEYDNYRQRWLSVPGDHAPGRLLDFARWQALCLELAELTSRADKLNAGTDKRIRQLQWALLVTPES